MRSWRRPNPRTKFLKRRAFTRSLRTVGISLLRPLSNGRTHRALAYDVLGLPEEYPALGIRADPAHRRIDLLRLGVRAHRRGTRADRLFPALQMREVVEVLALPLGKDPGIAGDVGDAVFTGDELAVGELLVQHRVEAT